MKKYIILVVLILPCLSNKKLNAQNKDIQIPNHIKFEIDSKLKEKVYTNLHQFVKDIDSLGSSSLMHTHNELITSKLIASLQQSKYESPPTLVRQLINAYPISKHKFMLRIAFVIPSTKNSELNIKAIYELLAIYDSESDKISFSSPIKEFTKTWNNKKVGNINYHYEGEFKLNVAENFDKNNSEISKKLGLNAEKLEFYKCSSYQEVLRLMGINYLKDSNGTTESSTIIGNTIITGINIEDFSHDIFHYYSSKLFDRKERNWTTEEGVAYSWGNAYYTDRENKVIEREILVNHLKTFTKENNVNLLSLFIDNPVFFEHISKKVSVRSTISSLICDEVENKKGIEGLKKLISCGRSMTDYFNTIDSLIGINQSNFNVKVQELLDKYK